MRAGGEKRGNSKDRKARREWMLSQPQWDGDGHRCKCVHCGRTLTRNSLTVDRIVPGGSYRRDNIQPACLHCNQARTDNPEWVKVTYTRVRRSALVEALA